MKDGPSSSQKRVITRAAKQFSDSYLYCVNNGRQKSEDRRQEQEIVINNQMKAIADLSRAVSGNWLDEYIVFSLFAIT